MWHCERCQVALRDGWLDVLCPPCLDQRRQELADALVDSRWRELAASHWARHTWWAEQQRLAGASQQRRRFGRPLREAS
jgi:hypothetical protein